MKNSDLFLFCFAFGFVWSIAGLLLGSFHLHAHGHAHGHAHAHGHQPVHAKASAGAKLWAELFNMHSIAIFLAWFGGCGYLMTRHSRFGLIGVVLLSAGVGLAGATVLASFLRALHSRERALDPFDYEMIGVLGRVCSPIQPAGTGEILFSRDGVRNSVSARSDDGLAIARDAEVVVTRYERGIAYVRTWDALTRGSDLQAEKSIGDGEEASPAAK
jgi:membrane protein implicated in regulation of membrane protease activity